MRRFVSNGILLATCIALNTGCNRENEEIDTLRKQMAGGDTNAAFQLSIKLIARSNDVRDGVRIIQRLADAEYSPAQRQLAIMHRIGLGVGRDLRQSLKWYKNAALQDNAASLFELAQMLEEGVGFPSPDSSLAYALYLRSLSLGFSESDSAIKRLNNIMTEEAKRKGKDISQNMTSVSNTLSAIISDK